jgi:hypothetical protein
MLSFKPVKEADFPAGFPTYTPVGWIEVKRYPAYRRAVAGGFWTLFAHIKANGIAMTAPVEMQYVSKGEEPAVQKSMAFLYGSPELGRVGKRGLVRVDDVEPQLVVSIGLRGMRTNEAIKDAKSRLESWIADSCEYEAAGSLRLMGYNSPYVPKAKQFFEVQIPIRSVEKAALNSELAQ